jgi:hypothetical protein
MHLESCDDMETIYLFLIILAVALAGYYGFRFLRNLLSRPILEINLSPVDEPDWSDKKKITDLRYSLQQKGFESAGDYECREIPSLILAGFVHPSEQTAGLIYDHPIHGIWVDVFVQYKDGGSLTVTNARAGHELDPMPHHQKIYCKGSSVDELLEKTLAGTKTAVRASIAKEAFASYVEAQYQKEMRWRFDRGGATHLEVLRVAEEMGQSQDSERLQKVTQQMQDAWVQEKNKPRKVESVETLAPLPGEFQQPDEFRRKKEQQNGPVPRLNIPALPVYLVLFSAMAYWCYYGYEYNKTHFPVSLSALIVFFAVFIVLFIPLIGFWDFNRRVRMVPVLQRAAGLRHGAFFVVVRGSPALFYARERWIGEVSFGGGGKHQNAFTRLEARMRQPLHWLEIRKKGLLDNLSRRPDKEVLPLHESDFSRKFVVSALEAESAKKLLDPTVSEAVIRLEKLGRPVVDIDRNRACVEIGKDLYSPAKEASLLQFLEEAETIVEAAAQQGNNPS